MTRMIKLIATAISVLCLTFSHYYTAKAEEAITLKVNPLNYPISRSGTPATIFIRIDPHSDNRKLTLEWDSDTGDGGSSEMQLEGKSAPRIIDSKSGFGAHVVFYDGNYTIRVTLVRSNGQKFTALQKVNQLNSDENEK